MKTLLLAVVAIVVTGCSGGGNQSTSSSGSQAKSSAASQPAQKVTVQQVKACSLLKKAEVETAIGRSVKDPAEDQAAELSTCSYGDPDSPTRVVDLSVFSGGTGYYAGPIKQAADLYDMAMKNAGGVETVSGFGDKAHWADKTLRVLRGPYLVEIEVRTGNRDREISEQIMKTVLSRLPS